MSNLIILTHKDDFTKLPLSFLFINNLTKHYKIYNMRFMILIMVYDFIQILHIKRKHPTNIYYFSKHN
jgi:hypothetical protein